jgi:hypothetical protein
MKIKTNLRAGSSATMAGPVMGIAVNPGKGGGTVAPLPVATPPVIKPPVSRCVGL